MEENSGGGVASLRDAENFYAVFLPSLHPYGMMEFFSKKYFSWCQPYVVGGVGAGVGAGGEDFAGVGGEGAVTVVHAPGVFEVEEEEGGFGGVGGGAGLFGKEAGDGVVSFEIKKFGVVKEKENRDAICNAGVVVSTVFIIFFNVEGIGVFAETGVPAVEGFAPGGEVGAGLLAAGGVVGKAGEGDDEAG